MMRVDPTTVLVFSACMGVLASLISGSGVDHPLLISAGLSALIGLAIYLVARLIARGRDPRDNTTKHGSTPEP